ALELDLDAGRQPGTEALSRRPRELERDGGRWQPGLAVAARHLGGQHAARGAVAVGDGQVERDALATLQRRPAALDQLVVERLGEAVILRLPAADGPRRRAVRLGADCPE